MKKYVQILLALTLLTVLTACDMALYDPVSAAQTSPLPGFEEEGLSPFARADTGDMVNATLYFRFMQTEALAQESRKLTVPMDVSLEKTLVSALLQGPGASSPELRKLFSGQVEVLSALRQESTLIVTLSEPVLYEPMENRFLQMQSLAVTLIENCGYESIQILVDQQNVPTTSLKLSNSFFDPNQDGPAPPLTRQDAYILSPYMTAQVIMDAWRDRDYETLYQFIAVKDVRTSESRPTLQAAINEMDGGYSLMDFKLGNASVSPDGSIATMSGELTLLGLSQDMRVLYDYPIRLLRENGIWKIQYQDLSAIIYR